MKLKKIVSLALAGILAVSMLAGCKGNSSSSSEGDGTVVPATSSAVDYANQTLNAKAKDYLEYVSASWLDEALKNTATDRSDFSAEQIKGVFYGTDNKHAWDDVWENNMANDIVDSMIGKEAYTHNVYENHSFEIIPANKTDKTIVWVETVSGALDEKTAVSSVAKTMSDWMVNEAGAVLTLDNGKYDCTYKMAISAVKVTSSSNLNAESAWAVAIAVTQNVAKATNTTV